MQQPFALNEQRESQDTHSTWPELLLVEETPCHHLLAEGHYISRVIQAPVLVGPELARAAPSSLNFIHQEGTAMLLGKQGREKQTCKPLGAPHPPKLEPSCVPHPCVLNGKAKPYSPALQSKPEQPGSELHVNTP